MYLVIARKYRPQTFAELIGQEHVRTTLENAIGQARIAHGYIFAGQRGTGKTTVARILARCLNCVEGPTAAPCGQCSSCLEIGQSNAPDVIEIDAASNRGINEMRELRESVRYRPSRDRFKVFIIDEAHQITNEAFNALLKTLEEPPEWAVFVLCTTEVHKIPATIASRCQQFSFRSVDFDEVVKRMEWICGQEGITADPEALAVLAQAGEGSVRDSLSALDQAIACCGSNLPAAEVRALLGMFSLDSLGRVAAALESAAQGEMLEVVADLERNGRNLQHFCRELARYFRNLLVAKISGQPTRLIAASPAEQQRLVETAARFSEEDLTRYLQLAIEMFSQLQYSLQPRLHLELGLLRMVHAGRLKPIEEALKALSGGSPSPASPAAPKAPAPRQAPRSGTAFSGGSAAGAPSLPAPSPTPAPRAAAPGALSLPAPSPTPAPLAAAAGALSLPAPSPTPAPGAAAAGGTLKERLAAALSEAGARFSADAVEHSELIESGGTVEFIAPKEFHLALGDATLTRTLTRVLGQAPKVKLTQGAGAATPAAAPAERTADPEEAKRRALAHPGVRHFQEIFPESRVSGVRDLKEDSQP